MTHRFFCLLLAAVLLLGLIPMVSAETPAITDPQPEVSLFSTGDSTAGHYLSGNDKKIYDALMPLIEKIAKGERASTILCVGSVPADLLNQYPIDASVDIELGGKLMNLDKITAALLADCPYEMYWYNKTQTGGTSAVIDSGTYGNAKFAQITFSFSVEESYAAADPYTIDTEKAAKTVSAINRAAEIVKKYKDQDDYSKLLGYKNEICNLVSYNHNAADNSNTPYGDPWQMIYVFDGDETTNVVCEGYAKAFQYLCDNTKFHSKRIQCYTVSGDMYASGAGVNGGGGGHMWNIVTMEDGEHYLVDVTNSDDDSIGQNGELFLAGIPMTKETFTTSDNKKFQRNCHVFTIGGVRVIYADDFYADVEHGYWDDKVLILADNSYEYKPVCDYTKAEIDENTQKLVLPAPVGEDDTVFAVVYKNGRMVGIKAMPVGEMKLDLSELRGDQIKAFFLNSTSNAPLAQNLQKDWK